MIWQITIIGSTLYDGRPDPQTLPHVDCRLCVCTSCYDAPLQRIFREHFTTLVTIRNSKTRNTSGDRLWLEQMQFDRGKLFPPGPSSADIKLKSLLQDGSSSLPFGLKTCIASKPHLVWSKLFSCLCDPKTNSGYSVKKVSNLSIANILDNETTRYVFVIPQPADYKLKSCHFWISMSFRI